MSSTRLEELLEQLVNQQAQLNDKIDHLNATLDDLKGHVGEIRDELRWNDQLSFGATLVERLELIEDEIRYIGKERSDEDMNKKIENMVKKAENMASTFENEILSQKK